MDVIKGKQKNQRSHAILSKAKSGGEGDPLKLPDPKKKKKGLEGQLVESFCREMW